MTHDNSGLNQARAARQRAEEELAEVEAQRPEVREVAKAAVRLRTENHVLQLIDQTFRRPA